MVKLQVARTYAYKNKNNYNIIWFFDCNLETNVEFVKLAKQLNKLHKANITADASHAKQEVMEYLADKKDWLLVFDNLKIGDNKKVKDLVDWEHNGHVIFCSQEAQDLHNIVGLAKFNEEDTITLARNILENQNIGYAKFLAKSFKGYPVMIVQGAQLFNQVKGLDMKEYKDKIEKSADKIKSNVALAIEELKPSAKSLVSKIALINNQKFSKQVLTIIADNKDSIDDDIYQLSKFALISNIDTNTDNPIYEMHDVITHKILEISGEKEKQRIFRRCYY
ncbi:MAG UNVERIFIED_CONTAM: hypothetical protein LVQ98_00830 [Rickettsiaceae bacterium]